ncbi:DUF4168 domain-containing protein [Sphingomonas sp. RS6]
MKIHYSMLALAGMIVAPVALAQTAPAQTTPSTTTSQTQTTPQSGTTPTAPATTMPATPAPVSDAEVKQYATAALEVNRIREDATVPQADKNAKFVEAIRASGLTAKRFNEISQAMPTDPDLNERIQKEAAAQQQAAAAAPATPEAPATQSAATPSTPNQTN